MLRSWRILIIFLDFCQHLRSLSFYNGKIFRIIMTIVIKKHKHCNMILWESVVAISWKYFPTYSSTVRCMLQQLNVLQQFEMIRTWHYFNSQNVHGSEKVKWMSSVRYTYTTMLLCWSRRWHYLINFLLLFFTTFLLNKISLVLWQFLLMQLNKLWWGSFIIWDVIIAFENFYQPDH